MSLFLTVGAHLKSRFSKTVIKRSNTIGLLKPVYKNKFYSSRLQLIHRNGAQNNTNKDISSLIFLKNKNSEMSREDSPLFCIQDNHRTSKNFLNNNVLIWTHKLLPLLREKIERCDDMHFLKRFPMEKIIMVTIIELLQLHKDYCAIGGVNLSCAINDVGNAIEKTYLAHKTTQEKNSLLWRRSIKKEIASTLISLVSDVATISVPSYEPNTNKKIIENIPVFYLTFEFDQERHTEIIKFSNDLTKTISCEDISDILHPESLPMLIAAPKSPLSQALMSRGTDDHSYVKSRHVYRNNSAEQLACLSDIFGTNLLEKASEGLDILGSIPWSVNKNILKVVLEVWNKGEAIAEIPSPIREHPALSPRHRKYKTGECKELNRKRTAKKRADNEKNNHSRRCDVNYKVGIASKFSNSPIYFPHDIDKDGFIYSKSTILNIQNDDLCRGLLRFNEAKPLGARGWSQLKVHLANLNGYVNFTFAEKEKYTVDNIENILDSADNPLTGKRWWLNNDSPWQCLAACYEIAAAYRSSNPEKFSSHLPIHQYNMYGVTQNYIASSGNLEIAQNIRTGLVDFLFNKSNTVLEQGDVFSSRLNRYLKTSLSLISVVKSHEKGMVFVPGHDSYWTHASDVDTISKDINGCLVDFYSQLVMKKIVDEVQEQHEDSVLYKAMMLLSPRMFSNLKKRRDVSRHVISNSTKQLCKMLEFEKNSSNENKNFLKVPLQSNRREKIRNWQPINQS